MTTMVSITKPSIHVFWWQCDHHQILWQMHEKFFLIWRSRLSVGFGISDPYRWQPPIRSIVSYKISTRNMLCLDGMPFYPSQDPSKGPFLSGSPSGFATHLVFESFCEVSSFLCSFFVSCGGTSCEKDWNS